MKSKSFQSLFKVLNELVLVLHILLKWGLNYRWYAFCLLIVNNYIFFCVMTYFFHQLSLLKTYLGLISFDFSRVKLPQAQTHFGKSLLVLKSCQQKQVTRFFFFFLQNYVLLFFMFVMLSNFIFLTAILHLFPPAHMCSRPIIIALRSVQLMFVCKMRFYRM